LKYIHFLLQGYRLAVCTTLAVFLVTLLVGSWSDRTAFALFLCASVVSAYFGGLRPGALATGIGFACLVIEYTLIGADSPYRNEIDFLPSLILFAVVGGLVTYLSHECRTVVKGPPPSLEHLTDRREAVLLADGKSQVAYLNDAARTLTGWQGNDAVGQALEKVFRVLDEENRQPVKDPLGRVRSTAGSPGPVSSGLFVCKDGSEKAIDYWLESLSDPQRGAPRALCVFRDVNDRRLAEKESRQNRERCQVLERDLAVNTQKCQGLENNLAEYEQRVERLNTLEKEQAALQQQLAERQRAEEKLRQENAELLKSGKSSQEAHAQRQQAEETLRREQSAWKKAEEKLRHELAELHAAKELAEEQASVLQRETETLRQGHKDAAEHKQAVEKLKDQHQKERRKWQEERDRLQKDHREVSSSRTALEKDVRFSRAILNNLGEGVCVVDREGAITYLNPAAERIFGRGESELLGKGLDSLRASENNGTPVERLIPRPLAARQVVRKDKVHFRKQDGGVTVVACSISALADPERGEAAVVCLQEGSGRARREEELSQQVKRLHEAVRRMDDFLDRITERFRPALMRLRDAALLPEPGEMLKEHVARFSRFVENVRTVSRLARDELALQTQPVELVGLINRAVQALSPLLRSRRQHLTVTLPLEPETLVGDAERLEQILSEVLDNAARYTAPGGNIRLTAERQGDGVVLRVQDTGRGIEAEALAKISELSARSRRFWDDSPDGLGVGLALAHNLVEMHGGTLELGSKGSGNGSELLLRLPAVLSADHCAENEEGKPVYQGPKRVRAAETTSDEAK
jgi:PAS domain S-box-containing protein